MKKEERTSTQPDDEPPRKKITKEEVMNEYAELKKNVDSKKNKGKVDADKLNKTALGRIGLRKEDEDEQLQEFRMIVAMAVSKKKQNYHQLKRWDQHRSEMLGAHRNAIQELQAQLDRRIKASIDNVQAYCNFFREKAKQEERYAQHSIIDPRAATENNPIATNVYINCTSLLRVLGEHSQQDSKRIQQFAHTIKKDILRERLEEHINQSQLQLLKVREKISALKASLQKCNAETEQMSTELATYYKEHIQDVTSFNSTKDFYGDELDFLRKAEQQTKVQKSLGEYCLEYLKTATQQQQKRIAVVKEAILIYVDAMKDAYKTNYDQPELDDLRKKEELKLVPWFFSLEELLNPRTVRVVKDKIQVESAQQLTINMFEQFLHKLNFEQFDTRLLVLKEYSAIRQLNKEISEPCTVVITVDGFIQLFYSKNHVYSKPNYSYKINHMLVVKSINDLKLQIGIKEDKKKGGMMSFLWDTKVDFGVQLRFAKKDNKEEFSDFIRKMV